MPKKKGKGKKYKAGDVIVLDNPPTFKKREQKWGVVLCSNPKNRWFLYINTNRSKQFWGPKIKHRNYPFLKGEDRFISCAIVHEYTFDIRGDNVVVGKVDTLLPEDLRSLRNKLPLMEHLYSDQEERIRANITTRIEELRKENK